ncbi:MAG: hypothetical protein CMP81_10580 [Fulvimarina sp.]|nr:hypothetical protein [Fulvimarina sp.]
MKTLSTITAAILALGIAAPTLASAAPNDVPGAPYNDNVDAQNLQAISSQPTPDDPMIPGSSASRRLYEAQVRQTVSASSGEGFTQAKREEAPASILVPGSGADF